MERLQRACGHSAYWTTVYNSCMACRAEKAESQLADLAPLLALVQEVVAAYPDPEPGSVMAQLAEMVKGA